MNKLKSLMARNPLVSIIIIFPFTLLFTISLFSLILDLILPALVAFWLAKFVYSIIVGKSLYQTTNSIFDL